MKPVAYGHGHSMIELLVAMMIAAVSLLGLAALQGRSLSMQIDSESRRAAIALVGQLRERVTANPHGYGSALATDYTRTWAPADAVAIEACADPSACDATTEVPALQLTQWMADVRSRLPDAAARVGPTTAGAVTSMSVTLGWSEPNATAVAPDAACADLASVSTDPKYRCVTVTFFPG